MNRSKSVDPFYVPRRGDIIHINFDPQAGAEQASWRPALVLTDETYNDKVGLCVVCPITTKPKGYAFEVVLPTGLTVQGAVLADHLKSFDWQERQARFMVRAPEDVIEAVLDRVADLLEM